MIKNTAGQTVSFRLLSTTDGSDVTSGSPTVYVTGDGVAQAAGTGTITHEGNGEWSYAPLQTETNYDHIAFSMVMSGAFSQTVNVYTTYPQTGDTYSAIGSLNDIDYATVNAACDTALADYGANTVTPPTAAAIVAEMDSSSSKLSVIQGYLDTEIAAILSDTGTTLDAKLNTIDTLIDSVKVVTDKLNDTLEDDSGTYRFSVNALENAPSGTGASAATIADAVWDEAISGHITAGTFGAKNQNLVPSETIEDYQGSGSGGDATAENQTTIIGHLTDIKGSTFSTTTDSLEAIRDRGDIAWLTGAGGSVPTVEEIRAEIDSNSIQLAAILADTNELQVNQDNWSTADLSTITTNISTLLTRLTSTRAGYLDKLNVTGTLAHSDAASTYQADISSLASDITTILTATGTTIPDLIAALNDPTASVVADAVLAKVLPDVSAGELDSGQSITLALALRAAFNRFYRKVVQTGTEQTVANDSDTVIATMPCSEVSGTSQTKGTA